MYAKLLYRDFRRAPRKNAALLLLMVVAVTVTAAATSLLTEVFAAVNSLYATAKPPHFLQMHMGDIDSAALDDFNAAFDGLSQRQYAPMIDLHGEDIAVTGADHSFTLADCRLDISFVKQNESFDLLLDENHRPLRVGDGEIAVPTLLSATYDIAVGDTVTLTADDVTKTFTVCDYVYDSMMNSTLCSSTRFLISDGDFDRLFGNVGQIEYMLEARLSDHRLAAAYQTAYADYDPALPQNGQAVTYPMILLLSAMTDMVTVFALFLAGVALLIVAVICLRYGVLSQVYAELPEIGAMKAIGIPERKIRRLYLYRVGLLVAAAVLLGVALTIPLAIPLKDHLRDIFGHRPLTFAAMLPPLIAATTVGGAMILTTAKTLKRLERTSCVTLLSGGGDGKKRKPRQVLRRHQKAPVDLIIGLNEARHGYGVILLLAAIVTCLTLIPLYAAATMEAEDFVTYMGSPVCDLLAETEPGDGIEEREAVLAAQLQAAIASKQIETVSTLRRVRVTAIDQGGKRVSVHIDSGDDAGDGIKYLRGRKPLAPTEIAVSLLLAEELGKSDGDDLTLITADQRYTFTLCGIYQDVTAGGKTAKTTAAFPAVATEKYSHYLHLAPAADGEALAESLRKTLGGGYSVENMESFLAQTLGGVTARLKTVAVTILIIALAITGLVTLLFMELRLVETIPARAAKSALGINAKSILRQELYPVLAVGGGGIFIGMAAASLWGAKLISVGFTLLRLGITEIRFVPFTPYHLVVPLLLAATLTMAALVTLKRWQRRESATPPPRSIGV